jgi:hypothetical protein
MLASISSRAELEALLSDKPLEWSRVIALRSAARAVPFVCAPDSLQFGSTNARLALLVFRATVQAYGGANFRIDDPVYASSMSRSCKAAVRALKAEGELTLPEDVVFAVRSSTFLADVESAGGDAAAKDFTNVCGMIADSDFLQAAGQSDHIRLSNRVADFWNGIEVDYRLLSASFGPGSVRWQRLLGVEPLWWSERWKAARDWLSGAGQGFEVWREWYVRRIEGRPDAFAGFDDAADKAFYHWIVEQDDDWWTREPGEVNADIKARVEELRRFDQRLKNGNTDTFKLAAIETLDLQSLFMRLEAVEASTEIVAVQDIAKLKSALYDLDEASNYARDALDRPAIGHNSRVFEDADLVQESTIPVDAVRRIDEQIKGIDARLLELQETLDKPNPIMGEVAKHGKGLVEHLEEIRKFSPEFFKGFESQFGKGLASSLSAGLVFLFAKVTGLIDVMIAVVGR